MLRRKIDFLEKLQKDFAKWSKEQAESKETKERETELDESLKALLKMADKPIENVG